MSGRAGAAGARSEWDRGRPERPAAQAGGAPVAGAGDGAEAGGSDGAPAPPAPTHADPRSGRGVEARGPGTDSAAARSALLGVYAPPDPLFVRGEGAWLIDHAGRAYLDFTSGIGVNALGHGAPPVADALGAALERGLVHTSNLFRTEPAEALARELVSHAFPGRVFFCNSGAEAVEGALKFARKWAQGVGGPGKHEVVAFHGSFHGRLFGSLAVTDQPSYRAPFEPLMPGARFVRVGDLEGLEAAVSAERTAAVLIEPVQGEGGIHPVPDAFLERLRALADERGAALVFDEIQCGLGRTGRLFAHEHAGVRPDLLVLAKPLAGGLPMGAVLAAPHVADVMVPGDHGSTFGGGPLVASVALAVLRHVAAPAFLAGVRSRAERLEARLRLAASRTPAIEALRGRGLMWGVEVDRPAAEVVGGARERGLLLVGAGPRVVRFLPPLNVEPILLDRAVAVLEETLA